MWRKPLYFALQRGGGEAASRVFFFVFFSTRFSTAVRDGSKHFRNTGVVQVGLVFFFFFRRGFFSTAMRDGSKLFR